MHWTASRRLSTKNKIHFNANLYQPFNDWSTFNVIDDIERDFNFKNILTILNSIENKENIDLTLLQCKDVKEFESILEWLSIERWTSQDSFVSLLTDEEKKKYYASTKVFDYNKDFDAYYCDFLEYYNIDLINSDIDFIRFNWLLNKVINKEDSEISKRIQARSYTKNKSDDIKYAKAMYDLKVKYALVPIDNQDLVNSMKGGATIGTNK